jgi:hypothetical protein
MVVAAPDPLTIAHSLCLVRLNLLQNHPLSCTRRTVYIRDYDSIHYPSLSTKSNLHKRCTTHSFKITLLKITPYTHLKCWPKHSFSPPPYKPVLPPQSATQSSATAVPTTSGSGASTKAPPPAQSTFPLEPSTLSPSAAHAPAAARR